ncbi:MAG: hypothetical protein K5910_01325, partial [Bacteroidales bacterium]|nr:hypothetical protein [Bacteroidales bacterium]
MRKRFLPFFVCALAAMLAVSCDPHHFPEDSGEGFSLTLHFNFDLPVHRTIEAQTKAKAKADPQPRARYTVQLHRYVDEYPYTEAPQYIFSFTRDEIEDLDTTIFLPIAPDRYKVLAWTDYVDGHGLPYWDATDFNEITLVSDYAAGKYARDAFRGSSSLDLSGLLAAGMHRDLTVEMTRPVARLRVIIPDG